MKIFSLPISTMIFELITQLPPAIVLATFFTTQGFHVKYFAWIINISINEDNKIRYFLIYKNHNYAHL